MKKAFALCALIALDPAISMASSQACEVGPPSKLQRSNLSSDIEYADRVAKHFEKERNPSFSYAAVKSTISVLEGAAKLKTKEPILESLKSVEKGFPVRLWDISADFNESFAVNNLLSFLEGQGGKVFDSKDVQSLIAVAETFHEVNGVLFTFNTIGDDKELVFRMMKPVFSAQKTIPIRDLNRLMFYLWDAKGRAEQLIKEVEENSTYASQASLSELTQTKLDSELVSSKDEFLKKYAKHIYRSERLARQIDGLGNRQAEVIQVMDLLLRSIDITQQYNSAEHAFELVSPLGANALKTVLYARPYMKEFCPRHQMNCLEILFQSVEDMKDDAPRILKIAEPYLKHVGTSPALIIYKVLSDNCADN